MRSFKPTGCQGIVQEISTSGTFLALLLQHCNTKLQSNIHIFRVSLNKHFKGVA